MRINNIASTKDKRRLLRKNMTVCEKVLWSVLRCDNLGFRFRRQFSIGQYITDFYCPQKKLIVEVDGDIHLHQKDYDRIRDKFMQDLGLRVLRFHNQDVKNNLSYVISQIEKALTLD